MWYAISSKDKLTIISGDIVAVGDTPKEVRDRVSALVHAKELAEQDESHISQK